MAKMGRASWPYYAQQVGKGACEYYLGVGEAPGRWSGRGLERLGIAAGSEVTEAQLEALFGRALDPSTGEALGAGWRADGVTGFDLCFSAPKSVSALWALAEGDISAQVRAAHAAAVGAALDYLDGHAAFSRTGRDGVLQVDTAGFAAATFEHRTSRAGDPQLHTHALVVNKLLCPDGTWRAIDAREIYAHKKSTGTLYQAALRAELTRRLGVAWGPMSEHGQAEILGIPTELIAAWSTRTAQLSAEAGPVIAAYEQTLGRALTSAERTAVSKVAVLKTRPGKVHETVATLRERWTGQAAELGWTPDRLLRAVRSASETAPRLDRHAAARDIDSLLEQAVTAAGARRAIFSRSDLTAEVCARIPLDGFSADMVREIAERLTDRALGLAVRLCDDDTGACRRASDARYASPATLAAELRILARADAGRSAGFAVVPADLMHAVGQRAGLDVGQAVALRRITGSGDFCSVLVAPAGTGKTTALGVATEAWAKTGHRVVGLAPTARAARELATATGTSTDTVAKFLHAHEHANTHGVVPAAHLTLDRRSVLVIDETGMLATADLDQLTGLAAQAGAKVVLVGDPHQLASIDRAGGMLAALANRTHAPTLETVHRFQQHWERRASLLLRAGNPHALGEYQQAERLHDHPNTDTAVTAMLEHWQQATDAGQRVLLLARSRHDVTQLNAQARARLIAAGAVHGPVLLDANLEWRAGDLLRATHNDRQLVLGDGHVRNGDTFTVLARARDGGLQVRHHASGEQTALPASYVREHAVYGWASTIDSAQGATVDLGLLLARPGLDRQHLYVGITRGRIANHVHLAPGEIGEEHHMSGPNRPGGPTETVHMLAAALTTSDEHRAAHTRLPDDHPHAARAQQPHAAATDLTRAKSDDDRRHQRLLEPAHEPRSAARGPGR